MHPVDGASISVLKFGGSVLCNRSALAGVATEVARFRRTGRAVLAVVSALQGRTDALLAECAHVSPPLSPLAVAARVASGVTSSGVRPVPPVVRIRSKPSSA